MLIESKFGDASNLLLNEIKQQGTTPAASSKDLEKTSLETQILELCYKETRRYLEKELNMTALPYNVKSMHIVGEDEIEFPGVALVSVGQMVLKRQDHDGYVVTNKHPELKSHVPYAIPRTLRLSETETVDLEKKMSLLDSLLLLAHYTVHELVHINTWSEENKESGDAEVGYETIKDVLDENGAVRTDVTNHHHTTLNEASTEFTADAIMVKVAYKILQSRNIIQEIFEGSLTNIPIVNRQQVMQQVANYTTAPEIRSLPTLNRDHRIPKRDQTIPYYHSVELLRWQIFQACQTNHNSPANIWSSIAFGTLYKNDVDKNGQIYIPELSDAFGQYYMKLYENINPLKSDDVRKFRVASRKMVREIELQIEKPTLATSALWPILELIKENNPNEYAEILELYA
jgi:hypothetical protein